MREDTLTKVVIALQVSPSCARYTMSIALSSHMFACTDCPQIAGSLLAFFVRYGAVRLFYDGDRK